MRHFRAHENDEAVVGKGIHINQRTISLENVPISVRYALVYARDAVIIA